MFIKKYLVCVDILITNKLHSILIQYMSIFHLLLLLLLLSKKLQQYSTGT